MDAFSFHPILRRVENVSRCLQQERYSTAMWVNSLFCFARDLVRIG